MYDTDSVSVTTTTEWAESARPEPSIQRALAMLDGEVGRLEEMVDAIRVAYRGAAAEDFPVSPELSVPQDKPFGSSEIAQRVQDRAQRVREMCDRLDHFARRSELSA